MLGRFRPNTLSVPALLMRRGVKVVAVDFDKVDVRRFAVAAQLDARAADGTARGDDAQRVRTTAALEGIDVQAGLRGAGADAPVTGVGDAHAVGVGRVEV